MGGGGPFPTIPLPQNRPELVEGGFRGTGPQAHPLHFRRGSTEEGKKTGVAAFFFLPLFRGGGQVGVWRRQTCGAEQAQAQEGRTPPSTPDKSGATSPAEAGEGYIVGGMAVFQRSLLGRGAVGCKPDTWVTVQTGYMGNSFLRSFGFRDARPPPRPASATPGPGYLACFACQRRTVRTTAAMW